MIKMIINADDFGLSRGVNYGIVDAFKNGILTSTTLMMNTPGLEHAIELSKQYPDLKIGLHLNIALGKPLTKGQSLVGHGGQFIKPKNLDPNHFFSEEEVYDEIEAQYEKFLLLLGRKPTHLDSHLFTTDSNDIMRKCAIRLADKYHLPLRNYDIKGFQHVRFVQYRTYQAEVGLNYIYDNIQDIVKYDYTEIMTHPAYMDSYIMNKSSYNLKRLEELDFLTNERTKQMIKDYNIDLISYEDVKI